MNKNNSIEKRMTILAITLPILLENMLKYLFSFIDMFMLSDLTINSIRYGNDAVSAVGIVTGFIFLIHFFFIMVVSGTSIIITQYNGAEKTEKVTQIMSAGILLSLVIGIIISITLYFSSKPILLLYNLNTKRLEFALDYFIIYGSFSFVVAMNFISSAILRSFGYSVEPTVINIIANILNIIGNYCFIYGAFYFPQLGVTGVAISTIFSQAIAVVVSFFVILRKKDIAFRVKQFFKLKLQAFKEILRIGIPNGGEYISYNLSMILLGYLVAQMDKGLAIADQINLPAYNYGWIFVRFIIFIGLSIGQGTQIITSYLIGAGRMKTAYQKVLRYFYLSFILALCLSGLMALFRDSLLNIFPIEEKISILCSNLLLIAILMESGRTFNLIIISALKGAGDVDFPVKMGIVSNWLIGVLFAFIFGIFFKLGIIGIWLGVSLDEWLRGIVMYFRWRSRVWQKKNIVNIQ